EKKALQLCCIVLCLVPLKDS
ncbi:threonine--tRNA ligase, partial [Chlamydia psittaci 84-8471/1]